MRGIQGGSSQAQRGGSGLCRGVQKYLSACDEGFYLENPRFRYDISQTILLQSGLGSVVSWMVTGVLSVLSGRQYIELHLGGYAPGQGDPGVSDQALLFPDRAGTQPVVGTAFLVDSPVDKMVVKPAYTRMLYHAVGT